MPTFVPEPCDPCCTAPPLLGGDPIGTIGLCLSNGDPIAIIIRKTAPDNTVCPPTDVAPPVEIGWMNLRTGVFTAGNPPADAGPCSEIRDVELAGRLCQLNDTTALFEASVFIEATYDTTVVPPVSTGYRLTAVLADGTVVENHTVPAGSHLDACPSGVLHPVPMCDAGAPVPVSFVRWFNSQTGLVMYDRTIDGAPYTVVAPAVVEGGWCTTAPMDRICAVITHSITDVRCHEVFVHLAGVAGSPNDLGPTYYHLNGEWIDQALTPVVPVPCDSVPCKIESEALPMLGCLDGRPVLVITEACPTGWKTTVLDLDPLTGATTPVPAPWPGLTYGPCQSTVRCRTCR